MPSPNRATTLLGSFRCAMTGLVHVFATERNARIHGVIAIVVVCMAATLGCSRIEFAIVTLTMGFVLVAEIANTAAETIVDLVSPEYHDLARIAKDVAAGGVLLAAFTSIIVGLIIMGPPLWALIGRTI